MRNARRSLLSTQMGAKTKSMTARTQPRHEAQRESLDSLIARFEVDRAPLEVNFKQLMPADAGITKSAHLIHPYPAKLLVNIPKYFLAALGLRTGSRLLDPFCGSGTVLYEGALAKLRPAGSDSNPLARLITTAKLTPVAREVARRELTNIMASQAVFTPVDRSSPAYCSLIN